MLTGKVQRFARMYEVSRDVGAHLTIQNTMSTKVGLMLTILLLLQNYCNNTELQCFFHKMSAYRTVLIKACLFINYYERCLNYLLKGWKKIVFFLLKSSLSSRKQTFLTTKSHKLYFYKNIKIIITPSLKNYISINFGPNWIKFIIREAYF